MTRELDDPEDAAHSQLLLAHGTVGRHVPAIGSVKLMSGAAYRTAAPVAEVVHKQMLFGSHGWQRDCRTPAAVRPLTSAPPRASILRAASTALNPRSAPRRVQGASSVSSQTTGTFTSDSMTAALPRSFARFASA